MTSDSISGHFGEFMPEPTQAEHLSAWEQFARAAVNQGYLAPRIAVTQAYDQARGTNYADEIEIKPLPTPQDSLEEHMQMLGGGLGTAGTIVLTAAAVRFGLGKVLGAGVRSASHSALPAAAADIAEKVLTTRTTMGLSVLESAVTGFTTGSVLKPTEDPAAKLGLKSFIEDRLKSGALDAFSFSAMTGANFAMTALGRSGLIAGNTLGTVAKAAMENPISSGIISGIPGGLITAEVDSLATTGHLTDDRREIGKSIYQMSIVGGVFGGITAAQSKISAIRTEGLSNKIETATNSAPVGTSGETSVGMGLISAQPSARTLEPMAKSVLEPNLVPETDSSTPSEKLPSVRARRRAERAEKEKQEVPEPTHDPVIGATKLLERLKKEETAVAKPTQTVDSSSENPADQKPISRRDGVTVKEAAAIVTLKDTPQKDELVDLLSRRGDVSKLVARHIAESEEPRNLNATTFGAIVDEVRRAVAAKQMVESWKPERTQSEAPPNLHHESNRATELSAAMQHDVNTAPAVPAAAPHEIKTTPEVPTAEQRDTITVEEARKLRLVQKYSPEDAQEMTRTIGAVRGLKSEYMANQVLKMRPYDFEEFNLNRLNELSEHAQGYATARLQADQMAKAEVPPGEFVTKAEALVLAELSHSDSESARMTAAAIGDARGNEARWIADSLAFQDVKFKKPLINLIPSAPGFAHNVEQHLESTRRHSSRVAHAYDLLDGKERTDVHSSENPDSVSRADFDALEILRAYGPPDVTEKFKAHLASRGPVGEYFSTYINNQWLRPDSDYKAALGNSQAYLEARKKVEQLESAPHPESPSEHITAKEIEQINMLREVSPEYASRMAIELAKRGPEARFMAGSLHSGIYGTDDVLRHYAKAYSGFVEIARNAEQPAQGSASAPQVDKLTDRELSVLEIRQTHKYTGELDAEPPATGDAISKQELQALAFFGSHDYLNDDHNSLAMTLAKRGPDSNSVMNFLKIYNPENILSGTHARYSDNEFVFLRNAAALRSQSLINYSANEANSTQSIGLHRQLYLDSRELGPLPKAVVVNFANIRDHLSASDPEFGGKNERMNAAAIIQMAGREQMAALPDWAIKPVYDHISKVGVPKRRSTEEERASLPFDQRWRDQSLSQEELQTVAKAWQVEPTLPVHLALKAGNLDAKSRLAVGVAWMDMLKERGATNDGNPYGLVNRTMEYVDWEHLQGDASEHVAYALKLKEYEKYRDPGDYADKQRLSNKLELAFYDAYLKAKQESPESLVPRITSRQAIPVATEALYPEVSDRTALNAGLKISKDPYALLPHVRVEEFQDASKYLREEEAKGTAVTVPGFADLTALRLTNVFDKDWMNWLNSQKSVDRNVHDATFWLSERPPQEVAGLADVLRKNSSRPIHELEVITNRWSEIPEDRRSQSVPEMYKYLQSQAYKDAKNVELAVEAARWVVSPLEYPEIESRYIASLDTAMPFPTEKRWSEGELTGRFIPRDDPRGLFLGKHTNCCQHPDGPGASSAWHGQENARGGYFVVEDKQGNVVAQSWTWIGDNGDLVFDNIEGKGLAARQQPVKDVYKKAADELSADYPLVTVGMAHTNLNFSGWRKAGARTVSLPSDYSGYTDAREQVILAENEAATPIHKLESKSPEVSSESSATETVH